MVIVRFLLAFLLLFCSCYCIADVVFTKKINHDLSISLYKDLSVEKTRHQDDISDLPKGAMVVGGDYISARYRLVLIGYGAEQQLYEKVISFPKALPSSGEMRFSVLDAKYFSDNIYVLLAMDGDVYVQTYSSLDQNKNSDKWINNKIKKLGLKNVFNGELLLEDETIFYIGIDTLGKSIKIKL